MSNGKDSPKAKKPEEKTGAKIKAEARAKRKEREVTPPVKPVPVPKHEHYAIGQWHEKPMFSCKHCPWSTLDEDEMVKHIADHLKTPSVRRTDTGFVTVTGNKIIREEIVDEQEV